MEYGLDLRYLCGVASEDEIKSCMGHGIGGCHEGGNFYDDPGDLFLVKAGPGRVDSETEKKYHI